MLAKAPAVYVPSMPRWEHQNRALDAVDGHDAFALFMEMRTGKTKVILDEFGQDEVEGVVKQLLVIAPAGVYRTWETDAKKHLGNGLLQRTKIGFWISGANAQEQRELVAFMAYKGPRILLVNVEALSTVKAAQILCGAYIKHAATTVVVDESTTIKNHGASRSKICMALTPFARKRRILSGLPSPQSPLDLWSQFAFLDTKILGFNRYSKFEERYAVKTPKPYGPGGRMINVITGYKNLDELRSKVAAASFRVLLSECYELPDKMFIRREVRLSPEQREAYRTMLAFAVAELEKAERLERVTATVVLTQMLRLHQILCGVTMSDDGEEVEIHEHRTEEMLSILENVSGKAIIWAAYDANVRRIAAVLSEKYGQDSVARFWGGNRDTREAEEVRFKTDPACRFMVATAAAGGRGRTWDVADTVIYFSNTFSLEHRAQSEERAQLVGKTGSVGYYDLVARGTVEERIIGALLAKKRLSNEVTGDNWRDWIS